MTAADRAALEIGRLFMRAHAAEQQAVVLAERVAELEAQVEEFTNATGHGDLVRPERVETEVTVPAP